MNVREYDRAFGEPEKPGVRLSFDRAARHYDDWAALQRKAASGIADYLRDRGLRPRRVLDVGTGTGYCLLRMGELFPDAQLFGLDLSQAMLQQLRQSVSGKADVALLAADAESLPFLPCAFDLVVSNLALQWCPRLQVAVAQCARLLTPGGVLVFTTFGPETLTELRQSWAAVDQFSHVNRFPSVGTAQDAIASSRLRCESPRVDRLCRNYSSVLALMHELKGLGAHNVTAARPRALTGKGRMQRMGEIYRSRYPSQDGGIRATFELVLMAGSRDAR